jgi:hypothetical protein
MRIQFNAVYRYESRATGNVFYEIGSTLST